MCVSVGEAGLLGVVGFWWLTLKLFIPLHSERLFGGARWDQHQTVHYILNWNETTRWEGSEEKMGVGRELLEEVTISRSPIPQMYPQPSHSLSKTPSEVEEEAAGPQTTQ